MSETGVLGTLGGKRAHSASLNIVIWQTSLKIHPYRQLGHTTNNVENLTSWATTNILSALKKKPNENEDNDDREEEEESSGFLIAISC